MLKICETTVKAGEEPIPKVRFRMPAPPTPAPVAESPAPTPAATPGFPKLKFTSSGAPPQTLPKITIGGSRCESLLGPRRAARSQTDPPEL